MFKKQKFQAKLQKMEGFSNGYFAIPFNVFEVFGKKSGMGVKYKIKNIKDRGYLMPQGDGTHCMGLRKDQISKLNVSFGDKVTVEIEPDTSIRTLNIPDDLKAVLRKNKKAQEFFDSLSYTNRKEYIVWITGSKREETRREHLAKTLDKLIHGKKNPYAK